MKRPLKIKKEKKEEKKERKKGKRGEEKYGRWKEEKR